VLSTCAVTGVSVPPGGAGETGVGERRIQGHREILAALRSRDPDAVEQAFRRLATSSIELLLGDLD
jgi:DNA-binding FadR family transcriptional regulator